MANRSVVYTDTLQTFFETYNLTAADVGDIATIVTTATNLVAAVNEVHNERDALDTRVGALATLNDDIEGASIVASMNLLDSKYNTRVGALATLNDDIEGASVVLSINLLDVKFENWTGFGTSLATTATTLATAINEVHTDYDGLNAWVGTRSLTFTGGVISATTVQTGIQNVWSDYYNFVGRGTAFTTSASTVVGAINEIESNHNALDTRVGALASIHAAIRQADVTQSVDTFYDSYVAWAAPATAFDTTAQTATGAVNELHGEINTNTAAIAAIRGAITGNSGSISITGLNDAIEQGNIIATINDFYTKYATRTDVGTTLRTTAQTLGAAVNEIHGAFAIPGSPTEAEKDAATLDGLHYRVGNVADLDAGFVGASGDNLVAAINASAGGLTAIRSAITGNGASIDITGLDNAIEQASIVATINDFYGKYATRTDVGTTLRTTAQTLGAAINEIHGAFVTPGSPTEAEKDSATLDGLHYRVGNLANLNASLVGANDDNIVAAINYIYGLQTGENVEFTNASLAGTLDVGGAATFDSTLTVNGAFTSLGIDDNATVNKIAIENASIALKVATSVTGALSSSSTVTGTSFITGANGSIINNNGEGIEFDNTANDVTIVASAASIAEFSGSAIALHRNTTVNGTLVVTGGITAAGGTVWHSGNDGSNSGLDADLLDGIQSSSFARKDQAETFSSNVTIQGNLTVNGTTTTINTTNLVVSDNIIILNNDVTGTPTENAGVEVERGTSANVSVRWNETSDVWELTQNGTNFYRILTVNDEGAGNGLDADTLDGQQGSYYLAWANLTGVPATFTPSSHTHATADITSGTFADARIAQSNVTQHQAALTLATTQITSGTFADARIAQSNVTQHQAALALAGTQITSGTIADARLPSTMAGKTFSSGITVQNGNISVGDAYGVFSGNSGIKVYNGPSGYVLATVNNTNVFQVTPTQATILGNRVLTVADEGAGNGLDADTLDGQQGSYYLAWANLTGVPATFTPSAHTHSTSDITSGTFADARIAQSNVTQHQAALALGATQVTSGTFDLARIPNITFAKLDGAAVQTSLEAFVDSNTVLMTAAAIDDRILSYGYTTNVGTITGVTAGNGLTGGGSSGSVTLNIGAGTGITVAADAISVNMGAFTTSNLLEGSNLYYTDDRANTAIDARVNTAFVNALGVSAVYATNAGALNNLASSQFLRVDAATTKTSGNLVHNDNIRTAWGTSSDTTIYHDGVQSFLTHGTGGFYMDMAGDTNDIFMRDAGVTRFTFDISSGNFTATGNVTAYSDINLKKDIVPILDATEKLKTLIPVYHRWNKEGEKRGMINGERKAVGLIAQDVERAIPEVVHENDIGDKLVAYERLVPFLIQSIKELEERIATLEAK